MLKNKQAELINSMSDREVIRHLYITQLILLLLSLVLAYFLFDDYIAFQEIWLINRDILFIGGGLAFIVILVDLFLTKVLPKEMLDDGGINERIFRKLSLFHLFFLCFLISFAEELLFRGVIQTHFGLFIASSIFALLHVRYLSKWVLLLSVVILSFVLGVTYQMTNNLWVTIFAHFLIDFVFALKIRYDYTKSLNQER